MPMESFLESSISSSHGPCTNDDFFFFYSLICNLQDFFFGINEGSASSDRAVEPGVEHSYSILIINVQAKNVLVYNNRLTIFKKSNTRLGNTINKGKTPKQKKI